jgi:hypothetical protein
MSLLQRKGVIDVAKNELLSILARHPEGLRTSELSGTPKFHGEHTLRSARIIKLLRSMPDKVSEHLGGAGRRTFLYWRML